MLTSAWTNMFVPLGGALQLPVPRLKRWQQLTLTHQLNQRTHIFSSFLQKLPNIMWSSRCLLEAGTRTPSASAKAAVHHQILQHWGLRGVSGGLSTLGQGPAQCKSRSMWGTHNLFPKINPQQQKTNSHFFSHRSSHRLHAQPPRYLFLFRLLPSFWAPQGQYAVEKKDGPR